MAGPSTPLRQDDSCSASKVSLSLSSSSSVPEPHSSIQPVHVLFTSMSPFTRESSLSEGSHSAECSKLQPKCLTMTLDNPFREDVGDDSDMVHMEGTTIKHKTSEQGDRGDVVSSISIDSLQRSAVNPMEQEGISQQPNCESPFAPPQEIFIPMACTIRIVPDWLKSDPTPIPPSPPEALGVTRVSTKSRAIARPEAVVRRSAIGGGSNRVVVADVGSASIIRDSSPSRRRHPHHTDELVGNRPHRKHHRGYTHSLSIGSLVGQSSFLTQPTTASSCLIPSNDGTFHHPNSISLPNRWPPSFRGQLMKQQSLRAVPVRGSKYRNPVKREMLYVLGKVAKPVKNLVRSSSLSEKRYDLRRSNGCLA